MSKPFIALCPEITRAHAHHLMDWLEDESVTRYLSDSRHVSRFIEQVMHRVQLPVLTHLFNQGGRFFMAYDRHDRPVGFVRLVKRGTDCEIVLVIGNRAHWGCRLGASALHEGMKLAFFEMRAHRLIAKIHADNTRSLRAFERCGFEQDVSTPTQHTLVMTVERYLQHLRDGVWDGPSGIAITEMDEARLRDLLLLEHGMEAAELEHELERATVVGAHDVASDVVTMNSRALLHLDGEAKEVDLVYPQDADGSDDKLSVYSDVGTAILGCKEGDTLNCRSADRTCSIWIEKVLYQPEAAGDFHL